MISCLKQASRNLLIYGDVCAQEQTVFRQQGWSAAISRLREGSVHAFQAP